MLWRLFLAAAMVLGAIGPAKASTTYVLGLTGTAIVFSNCGFVGPPCDPNGLPYAWRGTVEVEVSGSGPGTYTGADFLRLELTAFRGRLQAEVLRSFKVHGRRVVHRRRGDYHADAGGGQPVFAARR